MMKGTLKEITIDLETAELEEVLRAVHWAMIKINYNREDKKSFDRYRDLISARNKIEAAIGA